MKNIKLFMCLAFIAFSFPAFAQTTPTQNPLDTLHIRLQGRNQVFITGRSLRALTEYQRADSLKYFFFSDLENALKNGTFPETPKRIHYFVNHQGKRRLKAEINEDAATKFDLAYEKTRMNLDLPPYHYTIYDLPKNIEMHFFLEDSTAFEAAALTPLLPAFQTMHKDRKRLSGFSVYRLEQKGFGFEKKNLARKAELQLTASGHFGAMLLGNQLSPVISYDLFVTLPNIPRSSNNKFRLGFSFNSFMLSEFSDGQFRNFNPGTSWSGILQSNFGTGKDNWFGLSGGILKTQKPNGLPKNGLKFGLLINYDRDSFAFETIDLQDEFKWFGRREQLMMFTYRRSIF